MDTNVVEVRRHVDAPPGLVYGLVSDITRMGEWSPETWSCTWVGGATGPAVGVRFKGRNRRGWLRWSNTPEVIIAEPGKEFAFVRTVMGFSVVWRYTMEPDETGTMLSESYRLLKPTPRVADWLAGKVFSIKDRDAELCDGMRQTLDAIAASAEASMDAGADPDAAGEVSGPTA